MIYFKKDRREFEYLLNEAPVFWENIYKRKEVTAAEQEETF
jgi:hypothetical protein